MKIQKIEIENFRGFEGKHELICQPQVNLFVGANGSGKSSVLDLIGMFLSHIIGEALNGFKAIRLSKTDINTMSEETTNSIYLLGADKIFNEWVSHFSLTIDYYDGHTAYFVQSSLNVSEKDIINNRINIPLLKYFGNHSLDFFYDKNKEFDTDFTYNPLNAFKGFYSHTQNFKDFIKWFVNQENIENRDKIRQRNLLHEDPFLKPVRDGINTFFNNLNYISFSNLRVENSSETHHNELYDLCADKKGKTFNLIQLSNGEQLILLMIADISRRLSIANPSLSNPLEGTGIVLIDEIETHLHPAWQREVIPALTATFPNIQFFITTHSPQVVSSVDRKDVFIIDDFKFVKNTPHTKGRDSNAILNEIFGVTERPLEAQKDFDTLYNLIDDPNKEQDAAENLEALKVKYGSDDPDWQRAKRHFEFLTAKSID